MRSATTIYQINRAAGGGVGLIRVSEPHVHTQACHSDLSTPGRPVLKCGNYDARELAKLGGWKELPTVVREAIPPDTSQRVRNHSPDGFEYGYGGSGPAQLALAILLDALEDPEQALRHYQDFKWRYVAGWRGDKLELPMRAIIDFIKSQDEVAAAFDTGKGATS